MARLECNFVRVTESDKLNREGFEKYQEIAKQEEERADVAEVAKDKSDIENAKMKHLVEQMQLEVKHALK